MNTRLLHDYMDVTETVTRTGEVRIIDQMLADGIVNGAIKGGYKVTRTWSRGIFTASVIRPHGTDPMLTYSVDTRD